MGCFLTADDIIDMLRDVADGVRQTETASGPVWRSIDLADAIGCRTTELAAALKGLGIAPKRYSLGDKQHCRGYVVTELGRYLYGWKRPVQPKRPDDEWRRWAACIGETDIMFPEMGGHGGPVDTDKLERARHLCSVCAVEAECLDDALRVPEPLDLAGVRAGTLPAQRRTLRRQRRRERERTL